MKTILITGITGLIGKHLMHRILIDNEYKIIGQYITPRNLDEYTSKSIEMRRADICVPTDIIGITKGCNIVVHSAARVMDHGTKSDFYIAHYDATKWILEDALQNGVKQFIYISSFGPATYLDRSKGLPDETTPLIKSGVHYDDAKVDTEELVKSFCKKHNIIYSIIRPAAVIGPDSVWVKEPLRRATTLLGVQLIDHGKHDACLIDADNLADGIYRTITLPVAQNQTYFFIDDYGITWKQYLTDLLAIKGYQPKGSIPKNIALGLANIMNVVFPIFGKTPPISAKSIMATGSDRSVDATKARRELNWESKVNYAEAMEKIKQSLK